MAKESNNFGLLIGVAIALLAGVIFVNILSEQTLTSTQKTFVPSQTVSLASLNACSALGAINTTHNYSIANPPAGTWRMDYDECDSIDDFVVRNSTGTPFVLTTDYTFDTDTGRFSYKNTALVNQSCATGDNLTYVAYSYCGNGYTAGWARTVTNMAPAFYALALLLVAAFVIFYLTKKDFSD